MNKNLLELILNGTICEVCHNYINDQWKFSHLCRECYESGNYDDYNIILRNNDE